MAAMRATFSLWDLFLFIMGVGGVKVGRREGSVVDGEPTTTPLDKLAEEERRTKECGREGGGRLQANYVPS